MTRKIVFQKRLAIAACFFVNGFLYANWTARLPELQSFFNISNSTLGTLLFTTALGALVSMPITGWITSKYRSEKTTVVVGMLFCCVIPFIPVSDNLWLARLAFFMTGFTSGAMDVTMNGQAVFVERAWKKPIMSSFHAMFSIGMAAGAGTGALFSHFETALTTHFMVVAIASLVTVIVSAGAITGTLFVEAAPQAKTGSTFQLPAFSILPLGIIAFCVMTGEGSMADWSAIYMHKVVGESEAFSALAFGIFGAAMTIGRLFGDYTTHKLGKQRLLLWNCIIAITGLSLTLIVVSAITTLIGFFMVGLGLATVVPIVYSTAGNTKGIQPATGIAMASTIGYTGFFVGPPAIGYLSDAFGLRIGLGYTLILFVLMMILILIFMGEKKPAVQQAEA
jgi:predicted MFS family arabinose efflux permease